MDIKTIKIEAIFEVFLVKIDKNLVLCTRGKNEFIPDIKQSSH